MKTLTLERPLAVFDIEATGISPRADRIVELAIVRLMPDKSRNTNVFRINPGIPIPPEATEIHGISDSDVADCPSFRELAPQIAELFEGCDLCGYNAIRYDIPMLVEEFVRADVPFSLEDRYFVDPQRIYHKREPRDLTAALRFYCGEMHLDAHGAEADVLATIRVLEGQLHRYTDLPATVKELDSYCDTRDPSWVDRAGRLKWKGSEVVINFGKRKGTLLRDIVEKDPGFINWMLRSDFPHDTREIVSNAVRGTWPDPPKGK